MMKKILLVFILGTGIFSCFCDDAAPFWNITDMNINFLSDNGLLVSSDSISNDSLTVIVDFDLDYVSEVSWQNVFVNTAMANSQCANDGDEGMKDPISNITLTANEDYNNFAAGASLNGIVQYGGQQGFGRFVDEIGSLPAVVAINFQIITKPTNLDSVKFTLQLDFDSGNSISKESEFVFWK